MHRFLFSQHFYVRVQPTSHIGAQMLETLRADMKACRQFLLLVHLYSRTDVSALALLRRKLLRPKFTAAQVGQGIWWAYEGHTVTTWL